MRVRGGQRTLVCLGAAQRIAPGQRTSTTQSEIQGGDAHGSNGGQDNDIWRPVVLSGAAAGRWHGGHSRLLSRNRAQRGGSRRWTCGSAIAEDNVTAPLRFGGNNVATYVVATHSTSRI